MDLYRKFLILFIIICFSYIIFQLLQKRQQLFIEKTKIGQNRIFDKQEQEQKQEQNQEGFSLPFISIFPTENSELQGIKLETPPGIRNFDPTTSNLPISQYIIKSSYCTPFTGSWVNLDAIKYVLSRGCRFIDIELYMIKKAVCVAQSSDPTIMTIESKNHLLLDDVLNCIALNAFMSPSPNPKDPLFLQLRIKSVDPIIYHYTSMSIKKNLSKLLYKDKRDKDKRDNNYISPSTLIGDLMGSIVLVIDKTVAPNWSSYPDCSIVNSNTPCYNLSNYANMIAGSIKLKTATYNNILDQSIRPYTIIDDTLPIKRRIVDISNMQIVTPPIISSTINNPDLLPLIKNYGVNFICYQFYQTDYNLEKYEELFSDNNSAFVSFAQLKI